ncbi:MAG TPA: hypothetical protein VNI01_00585, partial [Elusimicrobiota bacterium]|nr:hypothetical protein [Elusimicrobiota bacterium]
LSTQYTAAPVVLLVPLAHFLCAKRQPRRWLAEGLGAWAAAFLAGTPFALLDAPRFLLSLRDIAELNRMLPYDAAAMGREVLRNLLTMGAPTSAAGLFALAGAFQLGARRRGRLAALLAVPILAQAVVVWSSPEGGWARYLLAVFPALALLAGEGVEAARRPALRSLLGAVLVLPGFAASAALAYGMTLPDTRAEAARWIEAHVPAGKTVLLDEEHASPRLVMAQGEAAELAGKLAAAGSPRARLYRAMAEHHPGGGYRILRMRRSALDLHAYPRHVDLSQAEAPMVDVSSGLAAARAAGVDYVVTSSHGLEPGRSPEAAKFFDELRRTRLLKELRPLEGEREGPVLRIYGLPAGQRLDAPGGRS